MEKMKENPQTLAMVSIPIQGWKPPYDFDRALKIGTLFPDLNKPFFQGETDPPENKEKNFDSPDNPACLMRQIDEVSFALTDLTLYLDTHPTCDSAISLFQQTQKKRKKLLQEFAKNFYPLTTDCIDENYCDGKKFCWTQGPAPWEGENAICSAMKKDYNSPLI